MINVICSLWGTKYTVDYVNKLYNNVKRNLHIPFTFFCQTDITDGLNSKIEIIPFLTDLPNSTPEEMWNSENFRFNKPRLWDRPKLNYWKPNGWNLTGLKLALDIDLIIQNDMGPLLDLYQGKPLTARSWWHNMNEEKKPAWAKRYGARNNGGIYLWEDCESTKKIWEDLNNNTEMIYFLFYGGSDNYISNRHLDSFDFVPSEYYYSFNRGCHWPDDVEYHTHRPEKIICVFNCDKNYDHHIELHEAAEKHNWIKDYWNEI